MALLLLPHFFHLVLRFIGAQSRPAIRICGGLLSAAGISYATASETPPKGIRVLEAEVRDAICIFLAGQLRMSCTLSSVYMVVHLLFSLTCFVFFTSYVGHIPI